MLNIACAYLGEKLVKLQSFDFLCYMWSAILGLTVLALGNCVADWVADTVVARAGKPEMAFASCFGSPLLSHVLGLSIAMIVRRQTCLLKFQNWASYIFG